MMKKLLVLIVIVIAIGTILPLFSSGFFPMHDNAQVARVVSMHKALSDGMFPVRWSEYLGYNYGYPIFNFYAPLAYYGGGLVQFIVHDPLVATKVMMGVAMLLAGVSMYLLSRAVWGELSGLVAAVFYVYIPYHALNLYVRGAVSELWAYAFLPLPFYGLYKLYTTNRYRYFLVIAIGFAAIILSHNLTALMVTPFLGLLTLFSSVMAYRHQQKRTALLLLGSLVVGGLLSAFYFIPALFEMSYTNVTSILGGSSNPLDNFVCLSQLWQSQWGFAGSGPGCIDGLSFMIGKLHILAVLAGIILLMVFIKQKNKQKIAILASSLIIFFTAVFLMIEPSGFIWRAIPTLQYLQFPWRFLSFVALSSSFIAGGLVYFLNQKMGSYRLPLQYLIVLLVIIGAIVYYGKYFKPQYISNETAQLSDPSYISWNTSKISDEYMPHNFIRPTNIDQIPLQSVTLISGNANVIHETRKTQEIALTLDTKNAVLQLNLAYFPAWKISLDGKSITPPVRRGVYILTIPSGTHTIKANFVQTITEKVANSLSLIGVLTLITGIIIARKRNFI